MDGNTTAADTAGERSDDLLLVFDNKVSGIVAAHLARVNE